MYILEVNHGEGEVRRYALLPGQTYTVGRKECRILLPVGEPSISRHHATITVSPMPRYSVLDPTAELEIQISDASKHGTFVGGERLGKDNTRFLYPEDRIKLGVRVSARIIPMTLILAISPDLLDEHVDLVIDAGVKIGALVVEDVIPSPLSYYHKHINCIGFLYVAENSFCMDDTMMEALGYGYTLVTPAYIAQLVKAIEEKDSLMPSEYPKALSPQPASVAMRSISYRRPAQTYFAVSEFLSLGTPIAATVFLNYTFVILERSLFESYHRVLELFGGTVQQVELSETAAWNRGQLYPLTTVALVGEDDFRIISDVVMERSSSNSSPTTPFSVDHSRPIITGYLQLYRYGVCLVPEESVQLALYRNETRELNTKPTACFLQRTAEAVAADATVEVGECVRHGKEMRPIINSQKTSSPHSRNNSVGATITYSSPNSPDGLAPPSASPDAGMDTAAPTPVKEMEAFTSPSSSPASSSSSSAATPVEEGDNPVLQPPSQTASFHPPVLGGEESEASTLVPLESKSSPHITAPLANRIVESAAAGSSGSPSSIFLRRSTSPSQTVDSAASLREATESKTVTAQRPNALRRGSHPFSLSAVKHRTNDAAVNDGGEEDEPDTAVGQCVSRGASGAQRSRSDSRGSFGGGANGRSTGRSTSRHSIGSGNSIPAPNITTLRREDGKGGSGSSRDASPNDQLSASQPPRLSNSFSTAVTEAGDSRTQASLGETLDTWRRRSGSGSIKSPVLQQPATGARRSLETSTNSDALQDAVHLKCISPVISGLPQEMEASTATSSKAPVRRGEVRLATASGLQQKRGLVRYNSTRESTQGATTDSAQSVDCVSSQVDHRFITPERDVVIHTAAQVGKSPPRHRVEAVRIKNHTGRRTSFSRDRESQPLRYTDPEETQAPPSGSMGNRCSVVRRESVSATPHGSASMVPRRMSMSYQRSDSTREREMPTPHRLNPSSRVGGSVPRVRTTHPYNNVAQRHVSPACENSSSIGTQKEAHHGSVRRRRSDSLTGGQVTPSPLNSGAPLSSSALSPGPVVPGQIPGLRGSGGGSSGNASALSSSATPATTSSAAASAEAYHRINEQLGVNSSAFISHFLDDFMTDAEKSTHMVVRQTYMDSQSKSLLENGIQRILEFLQYLSSTEADIPAMYSTSSTRATCHQVRQKAMYILSRIKTCYKTVNCKAPSSLSRAKAALSSRLASPHRHKRFNPATDAHESAPRRRQSLF